MKIGELRIKFEYGHQRNGQLEQRITVASQIQESIYHNPKRKTKPTETSDDFCYVNINSLKGTS